MTSDRSYHIIAIHVPNKRTHVCTTTPESHEVARRLMGKLTKHPQGRLQLWEVGTSLPEGCWLDPDDGHHRKLFPHLLKEDEAP